MASGLTGPTAIHLRLAAGRRPIGLLATGPSRSGASALAAAAAHLGAATRADAFSSVLNEITTELGADWSDWAALPEAWFESEAAGSHARRLAVALDEAFAGEALFIVEDPRIGRLAPLWRHAMALAGFEACFILVAGDPSEAIAVQVEAGRSRTAAALTWLRSTLDAERGSRDCRRLILADPAVNGDWRRAMARTAAAFGFAWPAWTIEAEADVDLAFAAARPADPPSDISPDPDDNVARWCDRAFAALSALAVQPDAAKPAERLEETFLRADRLANQIAPVVREEVAAVERVYAANDRNNQKRVAIFKARAQEATAALEQVRRAGVVAQPSQDLPPAEPPPEAVQASEPSQEAEADTPWRDNHRTADMQAEIDALRAASLDASALVAARDRDIEDLQHALSDARGAADALERLQAEHAQAQEGLTRAQADAERWRGAAHRLADEVGAKVAAALGAAARREAEASSALAAALADAHSLTVERASLSGRVAGLEAALEMRRAAATKAAEQAEVAASALRDELAAAGREIEDLRAASEARAAALRAWEERGFWRRMLGARPKARRKP